MHNRCVIDKLWVDGWWIEERGGGVWGGGGLGGELVE